MDPKPTDPASTNIRRIILLTALMILITFLK